jgi:hypothetical protein
MVSSSALAPELSDRFAECQHVHSHLATGLKEGANSIVDLLVVGASQYLGSM